MNGCHDSPFFTSTKCSHGALFLAETGHNVWCLSTLESVPWLSKGLQKEYNQEVSRILRTANSVWSCPHNAPLCVWGDYEVLDRGHLNLKVNKQARPESRVPFLFFFQINSSEPGSCSFHLLFSSSANILYCNTVWKLQPDYPENIAVFSCKVQPITPHVCPGVLGSTSPSFGASEVFVSGAILDAQPLTLPHLLTEVCVCVCLWEGCWKEVTWSHQDHSVLAL